MKEDIKEIGEIMKELRAIKNDSDLSLLEAAIQIQRNRILERALFTVQPNGKGTFFSQSNLQTIAENN